MKLILRHRAGFTLIELLVVVVVVGILAQVGLSNYKAAQDKARNTSVLSNTRSVYLGIENFQTDNSGSLPVDLIGADDPTKYLAAKGGTGNTGAFPVKYVPGCLLPPSPWGGKPQESMDDIFNNVTTQSIAALGGKVQEGQQFAFTNEGYFVDGGGSSGGPAPQGHGPSERNHYGYVYYISNRDAGRFAVLGIGKNKNLAPVTAVKSNY